MHHQPLVGQHQLVLGPLVACLGVTHRAVGLGQPLGRDVRPLLNVADASLGVAQTAEEVLQLGPVQPTGGILVVIARLEPVARQRPQLGHGHAQRPLHLGDDLQVVVLACSQLLDARHHAAEVGLAKGDAAQAGDHLLPQLGHPLVAILARALLGRHHLAVQGHQLVADGREALLIGVQQGAVVVGLVVQVQGVELARAAALTVVQQLHHADGGGEADPQGVQQGLLQALGGLHLGLTRQQRHLLELAHVDGDRIGGELYVGSP